MSVFISLVSDWDGRGIAKAIQQFAKLESASEKAQFALRKAALPATAALGGLAVAGYKAAQAAAEDEKAQTLLARQLRASAGATDAQVAAVEEQIGAFTNLAAVADDVLRPAFARIVSATKDIGTANEIMRVSLDTAAATGLDVARVAEAMALGFSGNTRALGRLSPELKKLIGEGASFADVMAILERNFGGAAKAAAGTTAGQLELMRIKFGELQESIGVALLPVLDLLVRAMSSFADFASDNTGVIVVLVGGFATLTAGIIAANAAIGAWNTISKVTVALNTALGTSFTTLQVSMGAVGIALAALGAVYMAFSGQTDKATVSTAGFRSEMLKSGEASKQAFAEYAKASPSFGRLLSLMADMGLTLDDLTGYLNGTSKEMWPFIEALIAASSKAVKGTGAVRDLELQIEALAKKTGLSREELDKMFESLRGLIKGSNDYHASLKGLKDSGLDQTEKSSAKLNSTLDQTASKMKQLRQAMRQQLDAAVKDAQDKLAEARRAYDDYASGLSGSIMGGINFGSIAQAGEESKRSFLDGLKISSADTQNFAVLLNRLIAGGASQAVVEGVAGAGVDAGTKIATELLNTVGGIETANRFTAEAQKAADQFGTNAAEKWAKSGVIAATAYVNAVAAVMAKYLPLLANKNLTPKKLKELQDKLRAELGSISVDTPASIADGGTSVPSGMMRKMGDTNVTIQVNGGDPNATVEALRKYMFQNGSIPIRVTNA